LPLFVLALVAGVIYQQGWHEQIQLESLLHSRAAIAGFVEQHYLVGLLAFFGAMVLFVAVSIPGATAATVFGGLIFGAAVGGVTALAGIVLGGLIMFSVARSSVGDAIARRLERRIERFRAGFQRNALSAMITLRLIPFAPFWVVTVGAAFLGVPLRKFLLGTAIGISPLVFILTTLGAGLDEVIQVQQAAFDACQARPDAVAGACTMDLSLSSLITPTTIIGLVGLALISTIPMAYRKLKKRS
jgi:uncharacterized membrane protein YdjX (TVP38/TMEM64 family)